MWGTRSAMAMVESCSGQNCREPPGWWVDCVGLEAAWGLWDTASM